MKHLAINSHKTFSAFTLALIFLFIPPITNIAHAKNEKIIKSEITWFALFMAEKKSGYMKQERIELENKIKHKSTFYMEINRDGTIFSSTQINETLETKDGKPLSFSKKEIEMERTNYVEGIIQPDGMVELTIRSGARSIQKKIKWPDGAMLNEGILQACIKHGLKEGTQFTITQFSLDSLLPLQVKIDIGKNISVKLQEGQVLLREIVQTVKMGTSEFQMKTYVDKSFSIKKMEFDLVGSKMVFLECTEEYALSPNEKNDIMSSVNIPSPKELKKTDLVKKIQYKLKIKSNFPLKEIPASAEQEIIKVNIKDNSITLSVKSKIALKGGTCLYEGDDKSITRALQPSTYVQSNNKKIIELARKIVGQCKDPYLAAKKIETFVQRYINKKNLNVSYASAVEVLENREGDCSEHAVLTTALCRAIGIPAKVATGFVYAGTSMRNKNIFIPHAWTLVFIKNQWISIDAAIGQFGSGHLLIDSGNGDPYEFFNLTNLLGSIEIIEIKIEDK